MNGSYAKTIVLGSAWVLMTGASSVQAWAASGPSARGSQILDFARKWLGTPYHWGGNGRSGIDCSGYLRQMYRKLFDVELPRTTRQQIHLGIPLVLNPANPSSGLFPGDLIFYIGSSGRPNHVVVYAGNNTITHSVSGRGVVIDPIRKVFGRRLVARRYLVPRSGDDDASGFAPIPSAGPLEVQELPCPKSYRARRHEVRRYEKHPLQADDLGQMGERDICDFRALAEALRGRDGDLAKRNARTLEAHTEWLQSIEAFKGVLDGRR